MTGPHVCLVEDGLCSVCLAGESLRRKTVHYEDQSVTLHHGDCLDVMAALPDSSVDAIVTDPPYGLGFMGREWDDLPPGLPWAKECLRVLKPGGHLLAFGGTRTWHRLACAIEDAGFEVRDSIAWLYGSGFPKSLDVSKAIDKAAGAEREVIGPGRWADVRGTNRGASGEQGGYNMKAAPDVTAPATDDARRWQGWGTALKPAFEPIVVGRKPLAGTVAANVLAHGTGALNIDGCRVGMSDADRAVIDNMGGFGRAGYEREASATYQMNAEGSLMPNRDAKAHIAGRWPANVVLDDSQAAELDRQSGPVHWQATNNSRAGSGWGVGETTETRPTYEAGKRIEEAGDGRGPSKFFPTFRYEPKAPTVERPRAGEVAHPTVKPLDLMRWLVRLVTPPGGTVLEPFAGSGTTAEACVIEGFRCIAIEREAAYLPLIVARLSKPIQPDLFGGAA